MTISDDSTRSAPGSETKTGSGFRRSPSGRPPHRKVAGRETALIQTVLSGSHSSGLKVFLTDLSTMSVLRKEGGTVELTVTLSLGREDLQSLVGSFKESGGSAGLNISHTIPEGVWDGTSPNISSRRLNTGTWAGLRHIGRCPKCGETKTAVALGAIRIDGFYCCGEYVVYDESRLRRMTLKEILRHVQAYSRDDR